MAAIKYAATAASSKDRIEISILSHKEVQKKDSHKKAQKGRNFLLVANVFVPSVLFCGYFWFCARVNESQKGE
jgi:hypothetical protein